jgi:nucleotide-binding universal stress UspA family protein
MYQTILVPIDLAHAERGKAMIDIAKKLGGKGTRITLMNVIEDIPSYVAVELPGGMIKQMGENAKNELEDMAKAAGISTEVEVHAGRPATAILNTSENLAAELIIIASHRPGLQDYLLGSTASRVVRHAKCSVLVMR